MSIIEAGLRADIMRERIEDKNSLTKKGDLYVGTGKSKTVQDSKIYETGTLSIPSGCEGYPLVVDSTSPYGLTYKKIQASGLGNILYGGVTLLGSSNGSEIITGIYQTNGAINVYTTDPNQLTVRYAKTTSITVNPYKEILNTTRTDGSFKTISTNDLKNNCTYLFYYASGDMATMFPPLYVDTSTYKDSHLVEKVRNSVTTSDNYTIRYNSDSKELTFITSNSALYEGTLYYKEIT